MLDAVSTVLGAQITVRDGRVVQSSFADYAWARIDRTPDIDVTIVPSGLPPGGLGDSGIHQRANHRDASHR